MRRALARCIGCTATRAIARQSSRAGLTGEPSASPRLGALASAGCRRFSGTARALRTTRLRAAASAIGPTCFKKRALIAARQPLDGVAQAAASRPPSRHASVRAPASPPRFHAPVVHDLGAAAGLIDQRAQKFVHGDVVPGFFHHLALGGGARRLAVDRACPWASTHSLRLRRRTTATSGVCRLPQHNASRRQNRRPRHLALPAFRLQIQSIATYREHARGKIETQRSAVSATAARRRGCARPPRRCRQNSKCSGASTMMVEPCSNQPSSSPLLHAGIAGKHHRPPALRVERDDRGNAGGCWRPEWRRPAPASAPRRTTSRVCSTARSFLQNSRSTRFSAIGLTFQTSPWMNVTRSILAVIGRVEAVIHARRQPQREEAAVAVPLHQRGIAEQIEQRIRRALDLEQLGIRDPCRTRR